MAKSKRANVFDLSGKVCVIIGAGLIGAEFARRCAEHGATVAVADSNREKGEKIVKEIVKAKGKAAFFECDATSPASVNALAAAVVKKYKKVDGVVNSIYPRTPVWGTGFEDLSYEDFCNHITLQTAPQFLTAQVFGKIMKKQKSGSLVFIGSLYAVHTPRFEMYEGTNIKPPIVEYAIAKGGLVMFTKYLAKFYGPSGVRVNMLSPGGIWDNHSTDFEKRFGKHVPLGSRMQHADELSATLVYFFAESSKQVTGQNILIDGGWTL